jgi:pimeloyl-ACP methyl ester carboxylesterase
MMKIVKKILKIVKKVLLVILALIIVFLAGTSIWNRIVCSREDKLLSQVGKDVEVNGNNLRVSVTGEGEKTVVLLSGLGTPSPIIDFKPLADRLRNHYKVVTLEYPGYGLSEDSSKEWTNEYIVEVIRSALSKLQLEPPYILMPHSISGIYALQYMKSYPEEVEAMIGIDATVPNQEKNAEEVEISDALAVMGNIMDITGITRLTKLGGDAYLKDMEAGKSYSKEDMKIVKALYSRKSVTKAGLSEFRRIKANCETLYDIKCPSTIPVLYILSKDSCEAYRKMSKERGLSETWEGLHEELFSNPGIQSITYLEGGHYLQWTQSEAIADMTEKFLIGR